MEIKINIGDPKTGKTHKKVLAEDAAKILFGKKIGETFKGEAIDLSGYEFEIKGGSDSTGFPMRYDVQGTLRKRILIAGGVGFNPKRKGIRRRKLVAGNEVYEKTAQINLKVVKYGKEPLEKPAEATSEEKKEE